MMFKTLSKTILTTFAIILLCDISSADIYAYKDSKGVLHLTNKKSKAFEPITIVKEKKSKNSTKSSESVTEVIKIIDEVCLSEGIDPWLVKSVAKAESGFNPNAISCKGAVGVMQLMPATAERFDVQDISHLEQNVRGGVRYLKYLLDLFSKDVQLAVAAYNAGEQRVIDAGGIPAITETINYVDQVLQFYNGYTGKSLARQIRYFIDENGSLHLTNVH